MAESGAEDERPGGNTQMKVLLIFLVKPGFRPQMIKKNVDRQRQKEEGNKILASLSQRLPLACVNFVSVEKLLISLKLILEDILSWVITTLVRNFNYCNRSHNISHLCPFCLDLHLHFTIFQVRKRSSPWLFTLNFLLGERFSEA